MAPKPKPKPKPATRRGARKAAPKRKPSFASRYSAAVRRGKTMRPDWARGLDASAQGKRYTWYAAVRVRQDSRGDVSDLTVVDVDKKAPPRVVTVALLGTVRSGARRGELKRLTRAEMQRDFDVLLANAIRRHGLIPAGGEFVRAVYRHESA